MRTRRVRLFVMFSALVIVAMILSSCASTTTPAPQKPAEAQPSMTEAPASTECKTPTKITYWDGLGAPDNVPMGELVKQYNAENKDCVQVEEIVLDWGTLYSKLPLDAKAGNLPCVSTMHMPFIRQYVDLGILKPVDDLVAQAGIDKNDIAEVAWANTQWDGKRYALPLDMHPFGLYYNVKMFKEAGLDPDKPPTNMQEFIDYAQKLTVDKNGDGTPDQYGTSLGYSAGGPFRTWMSLLWQQGGKVLTDDGTKAAFNTPEAEKALQFLHDWVYKYKISPKAEEDTDSDFMKGVVAMTITGPWAMGDYDKIDGLEYRTAPVPIFYDQQAVWDQPHSIVFPDCGSPEGTAAAIKFAKWLAYDQDYYWTSHSGHQPIRKSVANSAEFKKLANWQAFAAELPFSHQYPAIDKGAEVFGREPTSPFVIMMESVMLDKAKPADAIAAAEKAVNDMLSQP
jgi:multiple sugar transport system substrate-binding protein